MKLEQIVCDYGFNDYYDMNTGRLYHLSEVKDIGDCKLSVPVSKDGILIGYAKMRNLNKE